MSQLSNFELEEAFNLHFNHMKVKLCGGFDEPLYLPQKGSAFAEIRYRHDFTNSALHELAHWSIAGHQRRRLVDYGYWYRPDGRNEHEQLEFYEVESKPQAIEWIFSDTIQINFNLSLDNLSGDSGDTEPFLERVLYHKQHYLNQNLPPRAAAIRSMLKRMSPSSCQRNPTGSDQLTRCSSRSFSI